MRRRLLFIFLGLLVCAGVFVATLPWWLGGVARWAGRSRGLTFGGYERMGYSRFVLTDVEYRHPVVRVTASRAEADTPVLWLWRHWRKSDAPVVVGTWRVEVERSKTPSNPSAERGWIPLRALLQRIATQLDRWLPRARAGAGLVRFPGGEIAADGAEWAGRELKARGVAYRVLKADATITFAAAGDDLRLAARTVGDASAPMELKAESKGANVSAAFSLWEQPATLNATFAPRGWLPAEASVLAPSWKIAAEHLKLGPLYARVLGSARIEWRAEKFTAEVDAKGEPVPEKSAPPLSVTLRGNGDLSAFTVAAFDAALPGLTARLSAPVTVEPDGRIRESAARFTFQADLAKQPWFTAKGAAQGEARLVTGLATTPVVEFSLAARDVTARDVALSSLEAAGRFEWPKINVSSGTIVGGQGERLTWHGGWDFRAKEILDAVVQGEVRRASVARWLPKQPEFDVVKIDLRASGALAEAKHAGRFSAGGVTARGLNPMAVSAEWRGVGATIEQVQAEAGVGKTKLTATASADRESLRVSALEFAQDGAVRLRLVAPAVLRWQPQLQLERLQLSGGESSLIASATAGGSGRIEISAHEIVSSWFSDVLVNAGPAWRLNLLALTGSWTGGPMTFSMSAGATLEIGEGRTAAVSAAARGDKAGINIEALRATEGGDTVVNALGHLPVTFTPGGDSLLQVDSGGALKVDATVAPNAAFWEKLASISGVTLVDPQASAHLTGTWQRPEGNAVLKAARLAIDPKRVARPLPTIESLDVQIAGDRDGVSLNTFSVKIEGQPVRAQGRLPVPDGKWTELFKQPLAMARSGGDLRLEVPEAEIAVFARFLPEVLAPKGRIQADVHYKSGGIEGFVKLRDAASRPLGPLGVLQEISADVALSGRKLALRGVTARSGGQPVTLSGTIDVPENGAPRYDLVLKGDNLPFVRQTGLLVRGDLDLKLQTAGTAPPRLSGSVRLRDSLFLSDVRSFLPKGGGSSPLRRPPYFAVETTPVNTWTLAVDVAGEQFLRLRTPVFAGVASARFRLGGTLGEPRAIGEIVIDEGTVRMPFASFNVMQGSIRLTEADPFEPAVYLRGTGRRYGYDLTMQIDGNASQPNVVFTSSPALDSEQVLLMVMTGAAPTNEISNTATQRVANLGLFLSQSLLGSLGSDAADADKLSFSSGEKISRQGKETYDIEYKLSDRWTVIGEYNEFDEFNAGLKWRVFGGRRTREAATDGKK